jgi:hypothetical protein
MSKEKEDMNRLRIEYAAYRREMAASPDTVGDTLSFKDWLKEKRKKKGE